MTTPLSRPADEIVVIGAGIIGIGVALELQRRGHSVRVIDRTGVAAGASARNAGGFAFASVTPLATPGIWRKAPGWLLDPTGPLSVPPAVLPQVLPWLLRFCRASLPDRFAPALAAQAALNGFSRAALERQIAATKGAALIERDGQLEIFASPRAFERALPAVETCRRHGIEAHLLRTRDAIAAIQPGIAPAFTRAVYTPGWLNTVDPLAWTRHLAARFRALGGRIETGAVRAIRPDPEAVQLDLDSGTRPAARVVVAAGAWSASLLRRLNERVPLIGERGYNTTLPPGAFDLRTHLTFGEHGFVVTRINGGVRVGGASELTGLDRPANMARAEALLARAARFLPGLRTSGGEEWMAPRPSLPDSLPVIGPSPRDPRVLYAFGHGHLGLTQSAGTAEIIAALIDGAPPPIPIDPFAVTRF